ncbi:SAM-dependent methyltransferase [Chitinimonas koreensis]|uniref:SAM-dependent methyltransferase n=1 Tax=Chitinimonas koreensis TaxID=356302 RepID=UPI00040E7166|nr:SAM-dependent methyltransferase [Chitinimonas koreensis]QNM97825.1 SAM-dependent methyltransferase [Chitinimonas koreensis]
MSAGTLYLVPAPLGDGPLEAILPAEVRGIANRIGHWVVENPKTARRFLKLYGPERMMAELAMSALNEHTRAAELAALLAPLEAGHDVGLISEAGCPGVADPGAELVRLAHTRGIRVAPLVGPSSILLALMAAGASGQRFRFHGYLPVEAGPRLERLKELERDSARHDEAQLFIETPYRNDAMVDAVLQACRRDTWLTVARNLTTAEELIVSQPLARWQAQPRPELKKRPAMFVLYAGR